MGVLLRLFMSAGRAGQEIDTVLHKKNSPKNAEWTWRGRRERDVYQAHGIGQACLKRLKFS